MCGGGSCVDVGGRGFIIGVMVLVVMVMFVVAVSSSIDVPLTARFCTCAEVICMSSRKRKTRRNLDVACLL